MPHFNIEPFYGLPSEDAHTWLQRFQAWTDIQRIPDESFGSAMLLQLQGPAVIWLNNLPPQLVHSKPRLVHEFKYHFIDSRPNNWLLEQQLYERVMLPGENIENYIIDIEAKCTRLNKTETEMISAFILTPSLRASVIQKQPTTFLDAVPYCRLVDQSCSLVPHPQQRQSTNMSDVMFELHSLKSKVEELSLKPTSSSSTNKDTSTEYFEANLAAVQQKTVICQLCNKKGHTAKKCYSLKQSTTKDDKSTCDPVICHKCHGPNHYAKYCLFEDESVSQSEN
ncbi:hypothetical protein LOTGIDRAFT_175776 [Lottia gigantea]|uniref:CCHC-type domain-containing protein n=1 Tax=Lottia gigantea TaxID=225164 RepID=V4A8Z8_LOTGI|nr:hypothetical protein LOTGIDRAFT_175776 [Lottia gigantea]ESO91525.1 hypothetical protein LOTGIDRAFT_175776 [Lottia gigantea]